MKCSKCGQEVDAGSNFCEVCGTKVPGRSNHTNKSSVGWIIVVILCVIAIVVLGIILHNTKEDLDYARYERNNYYEMYVAEQNAKQETSSENYSLKEFKNNVSKIYPIIISDIKIGNAYYDGTIETDYGNTLYDYNTMYLKPQIYYNGLKTGSQYLKIKWISPSGDLITGSSSPYGYTQASSYYLSEGENVIVLEGCGSPNRGCWSSGRHIIEVWYGDVCLKSKSFMIY